MTGCTIRSSILAASLVLFFACKPASQPASESKEEGFGEWLKGCKTTYATCQTGGVFCSDKDGRLKFNFISGSLEFTVKKLDTGGNQFRGKMFFLEGVGKFKDSKGETSDVTTIEFESCTGNKGTDDYKDLCASLKIPLPDYEYYLKSIAYHCTMSDEFAPRK